MTKHALEEEIIFAVLGGEVESGCNLCPANMLQRKNVEERSRPLVLTMFIGRVSCFLLPSSTAVNTRNVQRCIWAPITLRDLQRSEQTLSLPVPLSFGIGHCMVLLGAYKMHSITR
jgi:hypothetical protein